MVRENHSGNITYTSGITHPVLLHNESKKTISQCTIIITFIHKITFVYYISNS